MSTHGNNFDAKSFRNKKFHYSANFAFNILHDFYTSEQLNGGFFLFVINTVPKYFSHIKLSNY